jgi:hypothetical protein
VNTVLIVADYQLIACQQAEFFAKCGRNHHSAILTYLGAKLRVHAKILLHCYLNTILTQIIFFVNNEARVVELDEFRRI